jgi:hypothetical protein
LNLLENNPKHSANVAVDDDCGVDGRIGYDDGCGLMVLLVQVL